VDTPLAATHCAPAGPAGPPTPVTVVSAPACHFCADAEIALAEIAAEYPLAVTHIDADSEQGKRLVAAARAPMYPLVLVDGAVFSWGRLPRRKLRRLLADRMKQIETAEVR